MTDALWLFFWAFLAATLVPVSSEVGLVALSFREGAEPILLWALATTGNTLGGVLNWFLGRYLTRFSGRRWFPFSAAQMDKAAERFRRWGQWSLVFAWLPIVGDPLTFAAGVLRTRFWLFLPLIALGKGARYGVLLWAALIMSA